MMSKDVDEKSRCHAVPLCVPRVWTVVERDVGRRTVDVALSSPRVSRNLGEVVPMISCHRPADRHGEGAGVF